MLTTSRREVSRDDDVQELFNPNIYNRNSEVRTESNMLNEKINKTFIPNNANEESYFSNREVSNAQIAKKLFGSDDVSDFEIENMSTSEDFSNPNLMPSPITMGIDTSYKTRVFTEAKTYSNNKVILNARAKILIASFVAVALSLVLIIALTAVSVANIFAEVDSLKLVLSEKIAAAQILNDNLNSAESEQNIIDRAESELGLQTPSEGQINLVEKLPTREKQQFTKVSSVFDEICDWFSSIIGG